MVPGHPDDVITVHLGLGRSARRAVSARASVSTRTCFAPSDAPLLRLPAALSKTGDCYDICVTKVHNIEHRGSFAQQDLEKKQSDKQGTYSLAGHEAMERAIIRYATLEEVEEGARTSRTRAASSALDRQGRLRAARRATGAGRSLLPGCVELQRIRRQDRCRTPGAWRST